MLKNGERKVIVRHSFLCSRFWFLGFFGCCKHRLLQSTHIGENR